MKKLLDTKYNHINIEKGKFDFWSKNSFFEYEINSKKPAFSILLPPPNITGKLHIGHAFDNAIPDLLIRFKKINGFNINWISGMDHAGIATQAKVEEKLWKDTKQTKYDIGREMFVKKIWDWKDEFSNDIRTQWQKMGLALNLKNEYFTYSEKLNKMVNKIFVDMYEKNMIYKSNRIIHWDCKFKTALSNIEVIYEEQKGKMYYFKYFFVDSKNDFLEIATTRPETIFADTAIVVNPNDERYKKYIGKFLINPLTNNKLKIIGDAYVEIGFGTGVMKCSPGHDMNDFDLGIKHKLDVINIFNDDATLNENVLKEFVGLDRFVAREKVIDFCKNKKTFIKSVEIIHNIGLSERSKTIVEPIVKEQWFVRMNEFAKNVIKLQNSKDKIEIFPKRLNDSLMQWMENIHDWTISRQLWWGHQIPVWYHNKTNDIYVSTKPPKDLKNYTRDSDVLDTWFSSGLLPFSCFDGWDLENKINNSDEFKNCFPNSLMVAGYDLIFFWIARMIFFSQYFMNKKPFNKLLFHGLVRDAEGQKMSKSLGNGIDPMRIIDEFGADTLKFTLITNSSPGTDVKYSDEKMRYTWNFINKIWNASRYILMNNENLKVDEKFLKKQTNKNKQNDIDYWILTKFSKFEKKIKSNIEKYEFAIAGKELINFVWNVFCSKYIELSKVNLNNSNNNVKIFTTNTMSYVLKNILIVTHCFLPFVTEEIYQQFNLKESILLETWIDKDYDYEVDYIDEMLKIIDSIREFKSKNKLTNLKELKFSINLEKSKFKKIINESIDEINNYIEKLTNCSINLENRNKSETTIIPVSDFTIEIENKLFIDNELIVKNLNQKLKDLENELKRSESMLKNEKFLKNANFDKIKLEKKKFNEYKYQYTIIKEKLSKLSKEERESLDQ